MKTDNLSHIDYLLIGHVTADIVPEGRALGGTVSYGAGTAHAFGFNVGVVTSASNDEPLLDGVRKFAQVVSLPAEHTSTFENVYGPDGLSRIQYIRGVASAISAKDVPEDWFKAPLVLIGPLTNEVDPNIVHHFPDSTIVLTLQGWLRHWDDDGRVRFKRWFDADVLSAVDVVVFSEEDILESPDLEQAIADLGGHLIVTRADNGGTHYYQGKAENYDAMPTDVVHATGAGDVFASSLLAGLDKFDHDMKSAIRVAADLAAYSITRVALDSVPTAEEIETVLARIKPHSSS